MQAPLGAGGGRRGRGRGCLRAAGASAGGGGAAAAGWGRSCHWRGEGAFHITALARNHQRRESFTIKCIQSISQLPVLRAIYRPCLQNPLDFLREEAAAILFQLLAIAARCIGLRCRFATGSWCRCSPDQRWLRSCDHLSGWREHPSARQGCWNSIS